MNYSRIISSSGTADEQYVSEGGTLSLSNLGQKELLLAMKEKDAALRTTARGFSMQPFIRDRDILTIAPMKEKKTVPGDVVAFAHPATDRLVIHRIIGRAQQGWIIKGDNCLEMDGVISDEKIIGYVSRVERNGKDMWLAIGQGKGLIAFLSRANILTGGRKILMFPRRIAGRFLQILQSFKVYRSIAGQLTPRIDILEASENDMEAVHQMFNPGVPYCRKDIDPNVTNWVAKRKNVVIGFVQNVDFPDHSHSWYGHWILSLHVRARYRGTGLGENLMMRALKKTEEQNIEEVFGIVYEDNKRSFSLLKKIGFEDVTLPSLGPMLAEEKIKTGRRRIVMRKKLV